MIDRSTAAASDVEDRQVFTDRDVAQPPLLVADAGRVITKKELHERLWPDTFVSDATLVGLVKMLRRTLGDHDARAPIIRTTHGVGYAFVAPIERRPSPAEDSDGVRAANRRIPLADERSARNRPHSGFRRPSDADDMSHRHRNCGR